ncbi:MAG: helix-turn-helix transcriptional regulator [Bacteroidaceae bacterium]|nr:helix-turn-helix transcriptional regulator [Bacteroidaceae bacterium]
MNIKKVIQEHGWTLERLAKEMTVSKGDKKGEKGISHAAVSQIINGNPTFDRLEEIASIIGISVAELVSDVKPTPTLTCPYCGREIPVQVEVKGE